MSLSEYDVYSILINRIYIGAFDTYLMLATFQVECVCVCVSCVDGKPQKLKRMNIFPF